MTQHRTLTAFLLCLVFIFNPGCKALKKKDDFSALVQPVSYRTDVSDQEEAKGVLGKTKSAIVKTGKFLGAGLVLIGVWVIKSWSDDDDAPKPGFDPNPLWRQGYGFNNPNVERIKKGLPFKTLTVALAIDRYVYVPISSRYHDTTNSICSDRGRTETTAESRRVLADVRIRKSQTLRHI